MNIQERKAGSGGSGVKYIGYWKGVLKYVNPTAEQIQELYNMEEKPEAPKYQGTTKEGKDWAQLRLVFIEESKQIPVSYTIFFNKEYAENKEAGKSWYVNQWGATQYVDSEDNLFSNFSCMQRKNEEGKWVDVVNQDGGRAELNYRKAYGGEVALYQLLRRLVNQDWKQANQDTDLFISIDNIMKGKVSDINNLIGTDSIQSVVGMIEIESKDGESGIVYNQNCVDGAWLGGWKLPAVNLTTSNKTWNRYDDSQNCKGKEKDMGEFYNAIKRNKNTTDFTPIKEFNPEDYTATSDKTLVHSEPVTDTDFD